ncbi:MAG TPA: FkbM family methyltransferase [Elusimicrobiota bacterium]|nr:FkbM family methyltransferase [Elusimicrobiota bacterium]
MEKDRQEQSNEWPEAGLSAALQLLKPLGSGETVMVDVGAHRGETLKSFSAMCGTPFLYVGLEPNPAVFKDFESVAAEVRSPARRVTCLPVASGPRDGETRFLLMRQSAVGGILPAVKGLSERVPTGDHEVDRQIRVKVLTVASLVREMSLKKIDLLKIDTEGYDLEVLKGALPLLTEKSVGAVMTEVFFVPYREGQAFFWDIAVFMAELGFHFVNLYDTRETTQKRLYTGNALWVSPAVGRANDFL